MDREKLFKLINLALDIQERGKGVDGFPFVLVSSSNYGEGVRIEVMDDGYRSGAPYDGCYTPESVNHLGEIFSENLKILCLWRYVFLQCFHPIVKKYLESYNPKTLAVIRFLAHFHLLGSRIQDTFNHLRKTSDRVYKTCLEHLEEMKEKAEGFFQ